MGNDRVEGNYEQRIKNILVRLKRLENAEVLAGELSELADDTGFGVYPHQYHGALTSFRWFDVTGFQYEPTLFTVVSAATLSGHQACNGAAQAADGDYVSARIPLVAGTYVAKLNYSMGDDFGIFYMSIDGVPKGSSVTDAYAASPSDNNELYVEGITINTSDVHEIRFVISGKSGSDYRFGGSDFIMVRLEEIAV
jgi:hypothetical protein